MELSLLGAFLGGVLTLLSPCSAMLLPAFFSYAFSRPTSLITSTGVFYVGLITTLLPMGVLAGSVGALVSEHREAFVIGGSIVVIALGLIMLAGIEIPLPGNAGAAGGSSLAAVYVLGTIYGLAGVCAGPLLGMVLTMAAVSGNAVMGGITMLIFALGMAVPLLVLSLLWSRLPAVQRLVRPRGVRVGRWTNSWNNIVGGILTIAVGVMMWVTSGTTSLGGFVGVSQQAQMENWVIRVTSQVPDVAILAGVLLLSAVGLLVARRWRKSPAADSPDRLE
ncbi:MULTISPECIES: cytochrome c biogenesis CcdA family protein [unclassified Corynebacterium]|uniref:cytochrome c biogenesis CcdA family protein n=1 Tax=unclassified Corynebacterium TaxID=2624378 RepID=UPI0029CA85C0|nr:MULTISPECIES: cytochrome c biogenesis CcdA family protein [unclassified Corynebacterium]WPF65686.1 cytochrome c biogenesis CcdA family protein [Corynebacterium sp. 22KM0430]WPF68182.1 cytochrome c biogenesis CcdA family protein [Corynebacterium sp. 21KM1197]